jgi:hypothetical protein
VNRAHGRRAPAGPGAFGQLRLRAALLTTGQRPI